MSHEPPHAPFPVYLRGAVEHGFGRGSKQLNCATANLPIAALDDPINDAQHRLHDTGVYFGWAQVLDTDAGVYPMVMSVGWNPQFQNEKKTVEVHVMHAYGADFYGRDMRVIVLGYIRPERRFDSLAALMDEIEHDKQVARDALVAPAHAAFSHDPFFT